jgi:hypothetical protein
LLAATHYREEITVAGTGRFPSIPWPAHALTAGAGRTPPDFVDDYCIERSPEGLLKALGQWGY